LKKLSYKYDVAFSFLSQDEALATEINDLVQDRLKTFLYSKRQGEIAGTDGEKTFNRVFGQESRVVAILYRSDWGDTPWTRIEKTAIRNRGYEYGYDFVVLIPLEEPPSLPEWLPKTRLWVGIKRWGPNGAASVIEARVQEQGGEPHEETVQERAVRFARSARFAEQRKNFLTSFEGVRAANSEFESLDKELQNLVAEIENSINLSIKRNIKEFSAENQIVILGYGLGLRLIWICPYTNDVNDAKLVLEFWKGHPPFPGILIFDHSKMESFTFKFDLTPSEKCIWQQPASSNKYDTKGLASFILKQFMEKIQKRSIRN
jgi:hypothetical protein